MDSLVLHSKQLESDLNIQQQINQSNLESIQEYKTRISELQQEIDQFNVQKDQQDQEQQSKGILYKP